MRLVLLAALVLLGSCASKKPIAKVDPDPYFILKEHNLECVPSQIEGKSIKPFAVMAAHPHCALLMRVYESDNIFFLDCSEDYQIGFTIIYTQSLAACHKIKALYLKNMSVDEI